MAALLNGADLHEIGRTMSVQWENWKSVTKGKCASPEIDHLFAKAQPHIYGGRMNGAGQGGTAMFLVAEGAMGAFLRIIEDGLGREVKPYDWEPVLVTE